MLNTILLLAALLIGAYYFSSLRTRELAVQAVRSHCHSMQLQLLDQSVSQISTRIVFHQNKVLAIQRCFDFEFTATGDERYRGKITMLNNVKDSIWLQAHRLPADTQDADIPL